jgi:integrase
MKKRLTDRTVKTLKPAKQGERYDTMDALVPGFGVRCTAGGKRTYILRARFPGSPNPTRRAIADCGALPLERARVRAQEWLDLIRQGIDPADHEARQRSEEARQRKNSFSAVAEDFIRLAVIGPSPEKPKQRKGPSVEKDIRREFLPRWGSRPINDIRAQDIVAVLDETVGRGAPYQAHNLLGHLKRLFNWAIARGVYGVERSPCERMKPSDVIGKKALRSRVLNDHEIRALWTAAEGLAYPFGPMFLMLLMSGQRRNEVADARWCEFDFESRLWTIPPERMKGNAAHVAPLTTAMSDLLNALPRPAYPKGDYLFSTTQGERPVSGFSKAKGYLDAAMETQLRKGGKTRGVRPGVVLEPFVIHDIRRSVRTGLSALPVPDMVRELVIAHARPGLHRVYDLHSYEAEKRHALELWCGRLREITTPAPENVVPLKARVTP